MWAIKPKYGPLLERTTSTTKRGAIEAFKEMDWPRHLRKGYKAVPVKVIPFTEIELALP